MSKEPPPPKRGKMRVIVSPAPSDDTESPTLSQLKTAMRNGPGVVRSSADARRYLEGKNYMLAQQGNTITTLTTILLSLVVNTGPRAAGDRVPDGAANVIKAVAILLEDAIAATYVGRITEAIAKSDGIKVVSPPNEDIVKLLQDNTELLKTISAKHQETIERTDDIAARIERLQTGTIQGSSQGPLTLSYRDALLSNARKGPPSTPSTPFEARLRNRMNIKACQVMVEVQSDHQDPLRTAYPDAGNPIDMLEQATNARLMTDAEGLVGIPQDSSIRSIRQCRANRFLIETRNSETADWIKEHPDSLQAPFRNQVKILSRLYPVVIRFMPTHFQTDSAGLRELETSAKLDPHSIVRATWIKDLSRRTPGQICANIKVFCETLEATNSLIMSSPQHLGSQLRTHKDIKVPSTCLKCQQYSHFAMNCAETLSMCGKCSDGHPTLECDTHTTPKCMPCGSNDHQTNDPACPEHQNQENAILVKDPETLTPYYTTNERWTWGLPQKGDMVPKSPPPVPKRPSRPMHPPGQMKQLQRAPQHQGTLLGSGFRRWPARSGANSVPIANLRRGHTLADITASMSADSLIHPATQPVSASLTQSPLSQPPGPSLDQPTSAARDDHQQSQQQANPSNPDLLAPTTNL